MIREDSQLIDVRVEYAVDKANAWTLVGVLIGELNMDFPQTAFERCFEEVSQA